MSEEKKDPTSHPDEYFEKLDEINAEMDQAKDLGDIIDKEQRQVNLPEKLKPLKPFRQIISETMEWMEDRLKRIESTTHFGIKGLDSLLHPIEPGDQLVICADTGKGKTAFALQALIKSHQRNSLVFSLEMSAKPLVARMIASHANISFTNMRRGFISEFEYSKMVPAVAEMQEWNVWIDENASSIAQICERAEEIKPDLLVVDYLQLVIPSKTKRDSSREREVAEISRSLKRLALELPCTVIALSQLNDEGRLRESRAIGQDADIVIHICPDKDNENDCLIKVIKHRNGSRGLVRARFFAECMRFEEIKEEG